MFPKFCAFLFARNVLLASLLLGCVVNDVRANQDLGTTQSKFGCEVHMADTSGDRAFDLLSSVKLGESAWAKDYPAVYQGLAELDVQMFQRVNSQDFTDMNQVDVYQWALALRLEVTEKLEEFAGSLPAQGKPCRFLRTNLDLIHSERLPEGWQASDPKELREMAKAILVLPPVPWRSREGRSRALNRHILLDVATQKVAKNLTDRSAVRGPFSLVLEPVFAALGEILAKGLNPDFTNAVRAIVARRPAKMLEANLAGSDWIEYSRMVPALTGSWAYYWPKVYSRLTFLEQGIRDSFGEYQKIESVSDFVTRVSADAIVVDQGLQELIVKVKRKPKVKYAPTVLALLQDVQKMLQDLMHYLNFAHDPRAELPSKLIELREQLNQAQQDNFFHLQRNVSILDTITRFTAAHPTSNETRLKFISKLTGYFRSPLGEALVAFRADGLSLRNVRVSDLLRKKGVSLPELELIRTLIRSSKARFGLEDVGVSIDHEIDIVSNDGSHPSWIEVKNLTSTLDLERRGAEFFDELVRQLSGAAFLQKLLRDGIHLPGRETPVQAVTRYAYRLELHLPAGITDATAHYLYTRLNRVMYLTRTNFIIIAPRIPSF